MGRKVSDKFAVPICRLHHRDLHRRGNERLVADARDRSASDCDKSLGEDACDRTR